MAERAHLSIGEVLTLLQQEFPDVTISKIRFLESQGLLDPERTPSGYRKFYDDDIERLRWILRQQREHFLPLKVIKGRLERGELDEPPPGLADGVEPGPSLDGAVPDEAAGGPVAADTEPATAPAPALEGAGPAAEAPAGDADAEPVAAAEAEADEAVATEGVPLPPGAYGANPLDAGPTSVSLSRDELAAAAGLEPEALAELERFGLVSGRSVGGVVSYDDSALVVARLAAAFAGYGLGPRHLRMYKVAAEREAGLFEQVVMPLVKQRNPVARSQAVDSLRHLAALGQSLHAAVLRDTLRQYTERG
ncbi:MAG TPA: MerR family transcriptional regulator [Acidimicrobiales bacterium]